MIKRSTWITLGLFILLLGITFLWQKSPEKFISPTHSATPYPVLLPDLGNEQVNQIEISSPDRDNLVLKLGQDKSWEFSTLGNDRVDQGKVEQLLSTIASASIITEIESEVDPKVVGLDVPTEIIRLHISSGAVITVKIGAATTTSSGYYVQVDENSPIVLRTATVESILDLSGKDNLTIIQSAP